jgi:hypothetical protein
LGGRLLLKVLAVETRRAGFRRIGMIITDEDWRIDTASIKRNICPAANDFVYWTRARSY